jgi:hypothetical protein
MEIRFSRTGEERKALVKAIGEILDINPVYKYAPSFAFDIGNYAIDKSGNFIFEEKDGDSVGRLLADLKDRGFLPEAQHGTFTIEIPKEEFKDTALSNLQQLIESKGSLIRRAISVSDLPIELSEDTIRFHWFSADASSEEVKAYTHFISALCEMAKTQHRVSMSAKPIDNEKYAFRCFLLRLGFIGSEYKDERKILLAPLSGNSAFLCGKEADSE